MAEPKIIYQDGKRYEFIPGEGGSLTVRKKKRPPEDLLPAPRQAAKVIVGPKPAERYALSEYKGKQVFTR